MTPAITTHGHVATTAARPEAPRSPCPWHRVPTIEDMPASVEDLHHAIAAAHRDEQDHLRRGDAAAAMTAFDRASDLPVAYRFRQIAGAMRTARAGLFTSSTNARWTCTISHSTSTTGWRVTYFLGGDPTSHSDGLPLDQACAEVAHDGRSFGTYD